MTGSLGVAVLVALFAQSSATTTPSPKTTTPSPLAIEHKAQLASAAAAGSLTINVTEADGYKLGRQVSIDGPVVEDRVVTGINNITNILTLKTALSSLHAAGNMVTMHSVAAQAQASAGKCAIKAAPTCVWPFVYKGLTYSTCTGSDAMKVMWCSEDRQYSGRWKPCTDPCKNDWPVKKIVGASVAGSVAAAGIGLIGAAIANDVNNGHFNPFHGGKDAGAKDNNQPTSTTLGPIVVIRTSGPAGPEIDGRLVVESGNKRWHSTPLLPAQAPPLRLLSSVTDELGLSNRGGMIALGGAEASALGAVVLVATVACLVACIGKKRNKVVVAPPEPACEA